MKNIPFQILLQAVEFKPLFIWVNRNKISNKVTKCSNKHANGGTCILLTETGIKGKIQLTENDHFLKSVEFVAVSDETGIAAC